MTWKIILKASYVKFWEDVLELMKDGQDRSAKAIHDHFALKGTYSFIPNAQRIGSVMKSAVFGELGNFKALKDLIFLNGEFDMLEGGHKVNTFVYVG
jgi:hypothetical protein